MTAAQILLLHTERGVFACANRCPHEGYPLSEGSLADGCVLTCNWHNWKFDLGSGATLVGGDQLPRYPVRLEAGRVWVDITPPDPELRRQTALARHREGAGGCRPATPGARGCAPGAPRRRSGRGRRHRRCVGCRPLGVRDHARHRRSAGLAAPVRATRHRRRAEVAAVAKSSATSPTMRAPVAPFRCRTARRRGAKRRSSTRSKLKTNQPRAPCCAGRLQPGAHLPTCGRPW